MIHPTVSGKRIKFMMTCLCDAFYADVARASYEVLEHLGCEIEVPSGQTCCGQPALNAGEWDNARKVIRHTIEEFEGTDPVVIPSGSCAAMTRHGAILGFEGESDLVETKEMASRSWELCEYIVRGLGIENWPGRFDGRVALHRSCHTRNTFIYESAVTLLSSIDGLELVEVGELDQCCGFGGTFCVSFPNVSEKMGQLKVEHLTESEPDFIASLDMACMMHFGGMMDKQKLGTPRLHVSQILKQALDNQ
jgi:L-lactate dehydrogenase complex protein LldE